MKRSYLVSAIVPLVLICGFGDHLNGQNGSNNTLEPKQGLAICFLRAINTAESSYHENRGAYAPWDTLMTTKEFTEFGLPAAARGYPELAKAHFSSGLEVLPGWSLRLDLVADGKGYDVLLQDNTDKTCGYAALTDERGVIRQSKAIDCKI